jgi:hypothetical protein
MSAFNRIISTAVPSGDHFEVEVRLPATISQPMNFNLFRHFYVYDTLTVQRLLNAYRMHQLKHPCICLLLTAPKVNYTAERRDVVRNLLKIGRGGNTDYLHIRSPSVSEPGKHTVGLLKFGFNSR